MHACVINYTAVLWFRPTTPTDQRKSNVVNISSPFKQKEKNTRFAHMKNISLVLQLSVVNQVVQSHECIFHKAFILNQKI